MDAHVKSLVCSCLYHLRSIAKLSFTVSPPYLENVTSAFISSHPDYCNSLLTCLNKVSFECLQVIQNAAARHLTKSSEYSHATPLIIQFHWLPVCSRILLVTFRELHGQALAYVSESLQP